LYVERRLQEDLVGVPTDLVGVPKDCVGVPKDCVGGGGGGESAGNPSPASHMQNLGKTHFR